MLVVNQVHDTMTCTGNVCRSCTHMSAATQLAASTPDVDTCSRRPSIFFPCSIEQVEAFAVSQNNTLVELKVIARRLGLRITSGSRGKGTSGRICFGVKTRVFKILKSVNEEVKANLFKFGLRTNTGFYQPSKRVLDQPYVILAGRMKSYIVTLTIMQVRTTQGMYRCTENIMNHLTIYQGRRSHHHNSCNCITADVLT